MKKVLAVFFIIFFIFGCSATRQNELKIKSLSDVKNVKNLEELNNHLPLVIDDDTVIVSVVRKKRNNRDILVYNYRLTKYEKEFIDIEEMRIHTHLSQCSKELEKKDFSVVTFSYSDKNSAYIGEFNFSIHTCSALYYEYKNNPDLFRKYLYSLSDIDFMHMGLTEKNFKGKFRQIYGDRLLDTDLDIE